MQSSMVFREGNLFPTSYLHIIVWGRLSNPWRKRKGALPHFARESLAGAYNGCESASPAPGKCLARHCPLLALTIISTTRILTQDRAEPRACASLLFCFRISQLEGSPGFLELLVKMLNLQRIRAHAGREAREAGRPRIQGGP